MGYIGYIMQVAVYTLHCKIRYQVYDMFGTSPRKKHLIIIECLRHRLVGDRGILFF